MVHEEHVAVDVVEFVVRQAIHRAFAGHVEDPHLILSIEACVRIVVRLCGVCIGDAGGPIRHVDGPRAGTSAVRWLVRTYRAFAVGFVVVVQTELVLRSIIHRSLAGQRPDGDAHRIGVHELIEQLAYRRGSDAGA